MVGIDPETLFPGNSLKRDGHLIGGGRDIPLLLKKKRGTESLMNKEKQGGRPNNNGRPCEREGGV